MIMQAIAMIILGKLPKKKKVPFVFQVTRCQPQGPAQSAGQGCLKASQVSHLRRN